MHAMRGQTVGKMATGVKIFDKSEELEITWKQAIMRDIVPVFFFSVSLIYVIVSGVSIEQAFTNDMSNLFVNAYLYSTFMWSFAEFVTMLFNKKRRAIHDYIAGTVVVRV